MSFGNAGVIQTPCFVLDALVALAQRLLDDEGEVMLLLVVARLVRGT